MPAAAVTPAPIAYIKIAAVKKLVVGYLAWLPGPPYLTARVSVGRILAILPDEAKGAKGVCCSSSRERGDRLLLVF